MPDPISLTRLLSILVTKRRAGKKIVFTNGCFDILHVGHVRYLEQAKSLGDVLVVGLNSDASVKKLKGSGRPVNVEKDRGTVLAALKPVDFVVIFSEETPLKLIGALRPDVLVKGGDWKRNNIIGGDLVSSYGGSVRSLPFVKGRSTSKILGKLRRTVG